MRAEQMFAINIKALICAKQRTQLAAAKTFGVCLATYNNWERGSSQPKIKVLISICHHYKITADVMLKERIKF
jgi:DNA-binding XRE family transcriptional regulator